MAASDASVEPLQLPPYNWTFVLRDLRGGIKGTSIIPTDPVVLSTTREFGVTDLGSAGICSFFSEHVNVLSEIMEFAGESYKVL